MILLLLAALALLVVIGEVDDDAVARVDPVLGEELLAQDTRLLAEALGFGGGVR